MTVIPTLYTITERAGEGCGERLDYDFISSVFCVAGGGGRLWSRNAMANSARRSEVGAHRSNPASFCRNTVRVPWDERMFISKLQRDDNNCEALCSHSVPNYQKSYKLEWPTDTHHPPLPIIFHPGINPVWMVLVIMKHGNAPTG